MRSRSLQRNIAPSFDIVRHHVLFSCVMTEWLTIEEACGYLKVNRRTLYRLMESGKLPYYHITDGGRRRIRKEDVDALLVPGEAGGRKQTAGT